MTVQILNVYSGSLKSYCQMLRMFIPTIKIVSCGETNYFFKRKKCIFYCKLLVK